jgi:hypothetical protein
LVCRVCIYRYKVEIKQFYPKYLIGGGGSRLHLCFSEGG